MRFSFSNSAILFETWLSLNEVRQQIQINSATAFANVAQSFHQLINTLERCSFQRIDHRFLSSLSLSLSYFPRTSCRACARMQNDGRASPISLKHFLHFLNLLRVVAAFHCSSTTIRPRSKRPSSLLSLLISQINVIRLFLR